MPFEVEHQVEIPIGKLIRASLKDLEVREINFTDRQTGEQKSFTKLNWIFEVTEDGDFRGQTVRAESSAYLSDHPDNQFRNWAEALLGRKLDLGQVLNEQDLIGLPALITVKYEADRKDPSKKWRRVEDVISADPSFGFGDAPFSDEPPF